MSMEDIQEIRRIASQVSTATGIHSLAIPTAPVNFNQQQIINLVIENRTSDPVLPVTGQIWLRTDL